MSTKIMSVSSKPPQTYSRLFRPWDGKSNQDSTVTSTTSKPIKIDDQKSSNDLISRISVASEIQCPEKIPDDLKTITKLNERLFNLEHHPTIAPMMIEDFNHADAMAYYANYPDFMCSAGAAIPSPYIGLDTYSANAMEQEYARVLAEEAQAKILSARKQRPKKFKCPHCDVAFSNNGQLKGHVRIHTGKLILLIVNKKRLKSKLYFNMPI